MVTIAFLELYQIIIAVKKEESSSSDSIQFNFPDHYLHASSECPGPNEWQLPKLFPRGGSANACCGVTMVWTAIVATIPTAANIATIAMIAIVFV